jgi:hypothetical protein
VSHNEECETEDSPFGCPICEEVSDDDPTLKNHILDVHLQPELLNIKQEPDMDDSSGHDDIANNRHDENGGDEGNKKKVRRRQNVRKATKKTSSGNEHLDDLDSLGTHFLDGYGKLSSSVYSLFPY